MTTKKLPVGQAPAKKKRAKKKAAPRVPRARAVATIAAGQAPVEQPVQKLEDPHTLTEDVILGALGLTELKLTDHEESILARPVNESDVLIKPSGQPYLSHPTYTRWFNEAFGRLGWSLVPRSKPAMQGNSVVQGYVLYIHGQPVAFAWGEQTYHEKSREQTYGDCLEATVASALRRCAKRLGIGLEMWDKTWLFDWTRRHCIAVSVSERDWKTGARKNVTRWRRKTDPKLPWEKGQAPEGHDEDDDQGQDGQQATARRRLDSDGNYARGNPGAKADRPATGRPAGRPAPPAAPVSPSEDDIPLGEEWGGAPAAQRPDVGTAPPAAKPNPERHNPRDGEVITPEQLRRFHTLVTNSGRNPEVVKHWLLARYRITSSKELQRRDYDFVCERVLSPGSLPLT